MANRKSPEVVAKIKADFPALTISQIANKYGVAWETVRKIVNPMKDPPEPKAARSRQQHQGDGAVTMDTVVNAWWGSLPLAEKLKILLRRV